MARKSGQNHDEPEMPDDGLITLLDEDGKESRFRILFDSLFVEDRQYVVMMPEDDEDALEPEIVILRVDEGEDGEGTLVTIDDDDEWVEVLKAFEEMDIESALGDDVEVLLDEEEEDREPRRKK